MSRYVPPAAPPGFFRAFSTPFRGMGFVARNPGLVRIWGIPVLIVLALWIAGCAGASQISTLIANRLVDYQSMEPGIEQGVKHVGNALTRVVFFILGGALSSLLAVVLSPVVAAPFNEQLAEEFEYREFGVPRPDFSLGRVARDVMRSVRLELAKLGLYLLVVGPLTLVGFFSGPLSTVAAIFGFFFTAAYFALDYVDAPLTRRAVGVRERFALLRRHPVAMLGFGMGVWVLLIVPFVQLFFMPAAVVGGTRLCFELGLLDALPDPAQPTTESSPVAALPAPSGELDVDRSPDDGVDQRQE